MLKQLRASAASGVRLWDEHWRQFGALRYDPGSLRWDGILDLVDSRLGAGSMLEAGCGLGKYVLYAAERGADVVGIDFVPEPLAGIRTRNSAAQVAVADLGRLPFPADAFDTVLCLGVLEHFEQGADAYVAELARVLRPGGWLIATVPYANLLKRRRADRPGADVVSSASALPPDRSFYQYCFSRQEARTLLERGGLEVLLDRRIARLFWLLAGRSAAAPRAAAAPPASGAPRGPAPVPASRRVLREVAYHAQRTIPGDWTSHMIAVVGRKPAAPGRSPGLRG